MSRLRDTRRVLRTRSTRTLPWLALAGLLLVACSRGADEPTLTGSIPPPTSSTSSSTTTTTIPVTTTTAAPAPVVTVAAAPRPTTPRPTTTSTTRPHPARVVVPQQWNAFAVVGDIVLHHPSDHVEAVGFHQSAQDGAQEQWPTTSARRWFVMESRDRDTTEKGAADIVVEPGRQLRVPVTGTVIRAGSYTLYCDHVDQYAVIEPDAHPGWEVKVLHIQGLYLTKGQRVEGGVTPLAANARVLPFPSQVEEDTGLPAWPHVHVEVVDPTVKDRPTGPGCD